MPWFYDSNSGEAENISGIADVSLPLYEGLLHTGTGWHEYSTQAEMDAAVKANGWPAPNQGFANPVTDAENQAGATAKASASTLTGLPAIGDFFQRLSQASTWERVGEVVLGVILIAVGLAKMTHVVPVATAIASKVP
jgi:hypothetical protein